MFPTLQPLFKKVFKILNWNVCQNFFTDGSDSWLSATAKKKLPFSTLLSFGNSQKSA
jgi:hypothetical protein